MWIFSFLILIAIVFALPVALTVLGYQNDNVVPDLLINLIAGGMYFVIGLNWDKIRSLAGLDYIWLKCIFGKKSFESGKINITLDTYRDIRLLPENVQRTMSPVAVPSNTNRFYKTFPDGHVNAMPGAFERLMGYCSARASSYLSDKLSPYFSRGVVALSDEESAAIWDGTFINLGSSASNIKSNDIKHHEANKLFAEDINGAIELKNGKSFRMDDKNDIGMILKIKNPHFENYSVIVCAGLGEWGTSGAAWYLSRHWKKFGLKYLGNDFVVIIKVSKGSDESAREIYSSESWFRIKKRQ